MYAQTTWHPFSKLLGVVIAVAAVFLVAFVIAFVLVVVCVCVCVCVCCRLFVVRWWFRGEPAPTGPTGLFDSMLDSSDAFASAALAAALAAYRL